MSPPLLIRGARVLTMGGAPGLRRGPALRDLGAIDEADVLVDGEVKEIAPGGALELPAEAEFIDAGGRVLMPSFIDAHTHALWAGDRFSEWERKLAGATYLELLQSGGGIMSTVRAVRAANQGELESNLRTRLGIMLREGTTTVEVKSGYGLTTADELKMLRAIRAVAKDWPGSVVPTALLGHALDEGQPNFVDRVIGETLEAVSEEFPGIAIDAYCEQGAWSLEDCSRLLGRAIALGHPIRVHCDQFNELGMTRWAIEHGVRSVDHLEAASTAALRDLSAAGACGVLLPCSGFHLDGRYANGRALVDAGGAVVIATNCNPGSAPTSSMPLAMALAVRECGLTPAEALGACTVNAAALLGFDDRGFIAPGARADLILLRHTDERALAHEVGGNPVDVVVCGGEVVC